MSSTCSFSRRARKRITTTSQMAQIHHRRRRQDRSHAQNELTPHAYSPRGSITAGEFSAALNPASLCSDEAGEQDRQRRVFVRAPFELFEKHCAAWFFWTYKKEECDAGWCLRNAPTAAIMLSWFGVRRKVGCVMVLIVTRGTGQKSRLLVSLIALINTSATFSVIIRPSCCVLEAIFWSLRALKIC